MSNHHLLLLIAVAVNSLTNIRFMNTDVNPRVSYLVKELINTGPYSEIRVHDLTGYDSKESSVLVLLLGKDNYNFNVTRMWYNQHTVTGLVSNYVPKVEMYHYGMPVLKEGVCPDTNTEFVSATPCDYFQSATSATLTIYNAARRTKLVSRLLMGMAATRQNYLDFMNCPQLGGFSSIGHGNEGLIFTYDGMITVHDFAKLNFSNLTTVVFNSCSVMNPPMSTTLASAGVQFFSGGVSDLIVGLSEPVTVCFWADAFGNRNMTWALNNCSSLDRMDIWGSEDPSGVDIFQR